MRERERYTETVQLLFLATLQNCIKSKENISATSIPTRQSLKRFPEHVFTMAPIAGKYAFASQDNFESFLEAAGENYHRHQLFVDHCSMTPTGF